MVYSAMWMMDYILQIMGLQSFDFFRKIQSEQQLSSSTGGIFTIASLAVAAFLIFLSIQDFTSVQYVTSLAVKNDPNEYLPMKIDIRFNQVPCELMTIKFHDELEYEEPFLERHLNLSNVDGQTETPYIFSDNMEELKERAKKGLETKRQCRIRGTLSLPKVHVFLKQTPGTLTFDVSGPNGVSMHLDANSRSKLRASYYLTSIVFGGGSKVFSDAFDLPISHHSPTLQNYIKGLEGDINTRTFIQDNSDDQRKVNYYSHLKIIPIFIDDGTYENEGDKQKYRYSLRAGNAPSSSQAPKLEINTQIEPINIVYKKTFMSFYELCVDILAIVGGSVATIGVVNSISHFLFGIK